MGTGFLTVDVTHVLSDGPGVLAFDAHATRAAYASSDGRTVVLQPTRPGDWRTTIACVALGLGGALLLWLFVAWRSGAHHVQAEKEALAEAAEQLGEPKKRRGPTDYFILVCLVALGGALGIVQMVVGWAFGRGGFNLLPFLNLFAAAGLLRFSRGWRLFVLAEMGYTFFVTGIFAPMILTPAASPVIRPAWGGQWFPSRALLLLVLGAAFAVTAWAYWVLTRWRTRVLFVQAALKPEPSPAPPNGAPAEPAD
jgi:hypothetical protein